MNPYRKSQPDIPKNSNSKTLTEVEILLAIHHSQSWQIWKSLIDKKLYRSEVDLCEYLKYFLLHEKKYYEIGTGKNLNDQDATSETTFHEQLWLIYKMCLDNKIYETENDRDYLVKKQNNHEAAFSQLKDDGLLDELGVSYIPVRPRIITKKKSQ